jgi:hypothetical protein
VNTNHGDTNRPRCVSNTQTQISIIGIHIAALLESLDNFYNRLENIVVKLSLFEFAKKLGRVSFDIAVEGDLFQRTGFIFSRVCTIALYAVLPAVVSRFSASIAR